jgi:uncharacterized membrane protein YkvA (DUF1232 family)
MSESNQSLISRILKSVFFKKAIDAAGGYAKNSNKLFKLLASVITNEKMLSGESWTELRTKIDLAVRMLRSFAVGEYRVIPWKSITRLIAVLIYFISPIDLIPDFLPVIGLTDDVALLLWLFNALANDLEAYRIWEKQRKTINIG